MHNHDYLAAKDGGGGVAKKEAEDEIHAGNETQSIDIRICISGRGLVG